MPKILKPAGVIRSNATVPIPDVILEASASVLESCEEEPALNRKLEETELPPLQTVHRTIIKEVVREAPPPSREELGRIFKEEIDKICKEAGQQARYEALTQEKKRIDACLEEIEQELNEMRVLQEQFFERYAQELKYFAIEVAEKMILEKIREDDKILQKMVMQLISREQGANWLRIELSDRLSGLIEQMKSELAKSEQSRVSIVPVAAPEDTCRAVTELGTTVATISVQADALRKEFSEADKSEL